MKKLLISWIIALAPLSVEANQDVFDLLGQDKPSEQMVIQQKTQRPKLTVKCNGKFYIHLDSNDRPIKAVLKTENVLSVFQVSGFQFFNLNPKNSLSFEFTSNGVIFAKLSSASFVKTVQKEGVTIDLYNGITEEIFRNGDVEQVKKRTSTLCEVYSYNSRTT